MKNKSLHSIKDTGFKAPDRYFEAFDDALLSRLNNTNQLKDIHASGFDMPKNYLDTFDQSVLDKIQKKDSKVVRLLPWKKMAYATAVAASVLLMFSLIFKSSDELSFETIETATIEDYIFEEDFTSLELAALFTEDELNSNDLVETTISDDSIEDYLLEHMSLEDLIIE